MEERRTCSEDALVCCTTEIGADHDAVFVENAVTSAAAAMQTRENRKRLAMMTMEKCSLGMRLFQEKISFFYEHANRRGEETLGEAISGEF